MLSKFEKAVAAKLKYFRLLRGRTQQALAAEAGVTTQQVQKYEAGECRMTVQRAYNLTQALKIQLNDLLPDHCTQFKSISDILVNFENNDAASFLKLYTRLNPEKRDFVKVVMKALQSNETSNG